MAQPQVYNIPHCPDNRASAYPPYRTSPPAIHALQTASSLSRARPCTISLRQCAAKTSPCLKSPSFSSSAAANSSSPIHHRPVADLFLSLPDRSKPPFRTTTVGTEAVPVHVVSQRGM
ncbi:Os01g0303550 [Oryza sativa Japonica Group]|uniref:Os01g0303550 protein n=1 Tax=Oryza sativa subsp. japonica TaxID=39947 RepID=A0A0P0V1E3_ORYSJ|nr:Os01g0303550 [Oryza sativa Japonica Group]